jgi:hypothetical protein
LTTLPIPAIDRDCQEGTFMLEPHFVLDAGQRQKEFQKCTLDPTNYNINSHLYPEIRAILLD